MMSEVDETRQGDVLGGLGMMVRERERMHSFRTSRDRRSTGQLVDPWNMATEAQYECANDDNCDDEGDDKFQYIVCFCV